MMTVMVASICFTRDGLAVELELSAKILNVAWASAHQTQSTTMNS
jgi:hypothetical protein